MIKVDELTNLAFAGAADAAQWVQNADEAVTYLVTSMQSNAPLLYVAFGDFYCYGKLVLGDLVDADHLESFEKVMEPTSTWSIEIDSKEALLFDPLDEGEEQLVFRRQFEGIEDEPRIEISQKLIHSLDLYWVPYSKAYCRLNEDGDIEPIILMLELKHNDEVGTAIAIQADALHRYMAITESVLVMQFDFMRTGADFAYWGPDFAENKQKDLLYYSRKQRDGSTINGIIVLRPPVTREDLVAQYNEQRNNQQHATFKCYDWKNGKQAEISCAPGATATYFEKGSALPYEVTPAFFRPEVLTKYKADSEKYLLTARSLLARRAGWYLKNYDVNEQGQVHTYLCYLRNLPYREQLYWQSFNEWPKGSISKRAYETDIQGNFSSVKDPLFDIKSAVRKFNAEDQDWWQPRPEELENKLHYPISSSPDEWAEAILIFDQLLVEGFTTRGLRDRLTKEGRHFGAPWKTMKLLTELAKAKGLSDAEATALMSPLKELHDLRSTVKGHSAEARKQAAIHDARQNHGSLSAHFFDLASRCDDSLSKIVQMM